MSRTPGARTDLFALTIGLACLGVGLVLYFSSTVPALEERAYLQRVERDHSALREQLGERLAGLRSREEALRWDPQTILMAIDDAKLTPVELLGEATPGMPAVPAWTTATK